MSSPKKYSNRSKHKAFDKWMKQISLLKIKESVLPYAWNIALLFYGHGMQGDRLNQTWKVCEINFLSVSQYFAPGWGFLAKCDKCILPHHREIDLNFHSLIKPPLFARTKTQTPTPSPPQTTPTGFILIHVGGLLLHKNWLFHASFIIRNDCFELFSSVHSLFREIFSLNLTSPVCRKRDSKTILCLPL